MAPKIQHKRSAVKGKAPLPADLDYGEIGVNYEATDPALYIKDSADAIRKVGAQPDASETVKGIVELATAAETTTGTDATRAVHPAGLKVELDKKANLASPALTGTPTAPTAAAGTNTTQLATTAFVTDAVAKENLWDRTAATGAGTLTVTTGSSAITATGAALQNLAVTSSSGTGTGLRVNLTVTGGAVTAASVAAAGTGYAVNDTVTIAKAGVAGAAVDIVLTVASLTGVVSPTTAGDVVSISPGTEALPGLTPVGDPDTGVYASAANEIGLAAKGVGQIIATENGVKLPYLTGNQVGNLIVDATGLVKRQALPFSWDANDDSYVRTAVADRSILVQARMKRCLVTDAGVVTYLDADDSTKLAGDWVRLVETSELDTAYTGTHQAEVANTELRSLATAWAAGTFPKGALVTNGGFVWECVAATTTATPAAGTAAATIDGTAGQVMVEIPAFSVKHDALQVGTYKRHELAVAPGAITTGGFVVHPAFVKPDGTVRDFIYVGAYQGTGTNGNGSASGVDNAVNFTRAACRTACAGRGAGWHQQGYWDYNALQWLLITEYQDLNSQRALGNGAMAGIVYSVATGLSNARGNRSANAHTPAGANSDYVSYRGVENLYGRAWQWVDGININERNVYLCADSSKWADDTAANYAPSGTVPSGSGSYQRDVMSGVALLPSSVVGASDKTYVGDGLSTNSGWRVARVGGNAGSGGLVGALCVALADGSSDAGTGRGGRLSYSP